MENLLITRIERAKESFADELLKCIEDGFDYTIEKYGTEVPKAMSAPDIIID